MRIPLLYRGEYSQWVERFMNYLEEQTDGEAMINSIKNGDQPLSRVTQVSIAGTTSTEQPPLKDKSMWSDQEKRVQKIDRLARSLLQMRGSSMVNKIGKMQFCMSMRHSKLMKESRSGAYGFSELKKITALLSDDKKEDKKDDEKKRDMSKVKCYNCKKEGHFAKDCKKAKVKDYNYFKTKMLLAKKDYDKQVLLADDQAWMKSKSDESSSSAEETISEVAYYTFQSKSESEFETLEYYNNSTNYGLFMNNDDDQENFQDAIESASEYFIENYIDSQKDYDKSQVDLNDYEEKEHLVDKLIQWFNHKIAKCQKQLDKHVRDLKNMVLDKDLKNFELEECTIQMIVPSKDNLYNCQKGIGFENSSYFEKEKHLRPTLYDEKVIGLGYTLTFLTHSNEALEVEKIKRSRENKIEFAYDYGNLNARYVNEKLNFSDDYFQEIINPDFENIGSLFQETSSLKPYVPNMILEKIIIDLEDEVVSLLEKSKLKTIESLKSKDCLDLPLDHRFGMFKAYDGDEAFELLISFIKKTQVNLQLQVQRIRTDNGTEFKNKTLAKFFDEIISGYSKHMMGNRALLTNFVENFLRMVRFGNNDFTVIAGYGDVVIRSMTIKKVYFVEGLAHNLFSVG
uniref:Integrase, catalytic region, zinc finger, CCHC-type, peptidase aspartic, catalytic n=1 Tax=Tanacetum cinerariifolium TaxID=118510 RepID=A0A6L2JBQ4_TANCI|nr:integrase, catalytic region, zinc finger, CCHC-type, peptidase aspartic, catalytic [Tanacetum cinerariifolium]